ncbi:MULTISPECIES: tetratricopeptide repeat protein [unclassified Corallococcus]|uniref:tetratricopeptide repeat protein n=1 Tax=unclassified Corallococcus TaxID=2685029 RepID=UPI001A8E3A51|nr:MULTISPECIES: tetratricopeptide repeat protein [unclassified Corallococcus]MBN9684519.1 tetratricopeptide repeat protein [Corallococcus sp. NCSPR001]WAS84007.1 tetratricopeptide repeat protein [Corallococcus sp. NCRR]
MTTRTKGTKPPGPADEEFLQQLQRGSELLGAGKVTEAKDFLERAHQLQPRHEKAQNLLGLTYFKLGLFDRAADLYEMLVRDNPVDPTLRVNLGLVYLKTNALQRAAREFETATDLAPDHKKAHNYLGLTFAQMGEYGRAREHFLLSGSDAMAEKMSRAIAGEVYSRPPAPPAPARPREEELPAAPPAPVSSSGESDWGAQFGLDEAPRSPRAAATPPPQAAAKAPDDDLLFAEDEGPPAPADSSPAGAQVQEDEDPSLAAGASTYEEDAELAATTDADTSGADVEVADELPPTPVSEEIEVSEEPPVLASDLESEPGDAFADTFAALATSEPPSTTRPAESLPVPRPAEPPATPRPAEPIPLTRAAEPSSSPDAAAGVNPPVLTAWVPSVALPGAAPGQSFTQSASLMALAVEGELLTRLEGLVAVRGQVTFEPEMKRFRGRATDKPFGEGDQAMVRARGQGTLHLEPVSGRQWVAISLDDESVYLRDACVFAFEEPVVFENGRVPSDLAQDLDLVHLRGQGRVLLSLTGPLRSVPVAMDQPATVPLTHLVGWVGNLTPRVVPLVTSAGGETLKAAVELGGEGFALIALGVR